MKSIKLQIPYLVTALLLLTFLSGSMSIQPIQSIAANKSDDIEQERYLIMFNKQNQYNSDQSDDVQHQTQDAHNSQDAQDSDHDTYEQVITNHGGRVLEQIPSLNTVVAEIPTTQLDQLTNHPAIKYMEKDNIISLQSISPFIQKSASTLKATLALNEDDNTTREATLAPLEEPPALNVATLPTQAEDRTLTKALALHGTNWTDWGTEKVKAPLAWGQELTGKGVKVAVIDTGVATHPDLQIEKGVSFTSYTDSYQDDNGHGTHVAGIIAAGHNPDGLRGVAPDVKLYAVKVLDQEGNGYQSNIIKGIDWAIEQNIDIINISVGGIENSVFLEVAVNKAYNEHNIIVVAAAGNSGNKEAEGNTVEFPANYLSVIAVAATNRNDTRADFSAHGGAVELAAPGYLIKSTYLNGGYKSLYGTSMAAPHISGMLALLKQAQPSKTNEELRTQIRDYTIDLGVPGKDSLYGFGRIEFPAEIEIEPRQPEPPQNVMIEQINDSEITLTWEHSKETTFSVYRDGKKIETITNGFIFTEELAEGTYIYELTTVNDLQNESEKTNPIQITIVNQTEPEESYISTADAYSDVKATNWFIEELHQLQTENLIGGYPDGTFRPNQFVTRAELAVLIGRVLQLNGAKQEAIFPDVKKSLFASGYIQAAFQENLINGYPNGTFRPHQVVTREEAAVIFTRAFPLTIQTDQHFPDLNPSHYTFQSIQLVVGEEIATGYPDGSFRPKQGVTRAELVAFLTRATNLVSDPL